MVEVTELSGYAVSWSTPSLRVSAASTTYGRRPPPRCTAHACSCRCAIPWVHQSQGRLHACGSASCRSRPAIGRAPRACPGATAGRLSQSVRLRGRVHGVVRHYSRSPPPPPSFPEFIIPTTPWPPGWICTCRTSTVCLCPRRCLSNAWISSSWRRSSRVAYPP